MLSATHNSFRDQHGSMEFLQLAAQDSSLFAELERDPLATLEHHGFDMNGCEIPSTITLPSIEDLNAATIHCNDGATFVRYAGFFGGGGD